MLSILSRKNSLFLSGATALAVAGMLYAPLANAVVPNNNNTPEDIVDNDGGVNGIGMFFRSDGFVCTGTLINPRTVLFAAHCVNDRPEGDYATGSGISSAFSFNVDALPGFQDWIANGFASNPDLNVFNINQIMWNPDSLARPNDSFGFLEGDIALASLDTPASEIPTWALLFSALPNPELNNVTGTGYHVDVTGYGRSGSGTAGATQGIDWRRRAAENYIGALTSQDERNQFLFGNAFGDLPQDLYRLDFDDPNKENPFDFNLYLDEPLANEGITAGGDSGGPLILDAANNDITDMDIVLGVLSGGSRFFGEQVFSSYGTSSFYQPLANFYEYIAANNPYRYASAQAGDGDWEDASHWTTDLDPAYFILNENNEIVNGFPDEEQSGINGTDNDFGAVCFDPEGDNVGDECQDLSNGEVFAGPRDGSETDPGNSGNGTESVSSSIGRVSTDVLNELGIGEVLTGGQSQSQGGAVDFAENAPQGGADATDFNTLQAPGDPLPAPTIENGLAGATNFVPDNLDPAAGVNGPRRYFDVTLSADGTTTLSSTVTIDRLTIEGAGAGLNIATAGNLTSLIDIEQVAGRVNVDGQLNSVGDYLLLSGLFSGYGTVQTPFFTNVMGGIAPGSMGGIGTLTIDGSAILASASGLMIDIAGNGVNDVLAITGDANLGGEVIFIPTADVRAGDSYTFLTNGGVQTSEFSAPVAISALLTPVLSYTSNSVTATIEAGSYLDAIGGGNNVQFAYANLLDGGRGDASLSPIFANLDLASVDSIQGVLDSWAPVTETTVRSLAKAATENVARFNRNRLDAMESDSWGGSVTVMGNPVQMASNSQYTTVMSDVAALQAPEPTRVKQTGSIPADFEIFLAGSFIDGDTASMPTTQNFGEEDFDGWAVTGGIEHRLSDKVSLGASISYTDLESDVSLGQRAETNYLAGTLYGQLRSPSTGVKLDGQIGVGTLNTKTERVVAFPNNNRLTTDDDSTVLSADLQVSRPITTTHAVVTPRVSLQNTVIYFDTVQETGGLPGLRIDREKLHSTQGRLGLSVASQENANYSLEAHGDLVQEFGSISDDFQANFVGLTSANAQFSQFGTDKTWGEVGVGLSFNLQNAKINISADTTIGRDDIEARVYRAGVTYKF